MVATHIKNARHNMFFVIDVYLRYMIFCNFALDCESSERLLFLFVLVGFL